MWSTVFGELCGVFLITFGLVFALSRKPRHIRIRGSMRTLRHRRTTCSNKTQSQVLESRLTGAMLATFPQRRNIAQYHR